MAAAARKKVRITLPPQVPVARVKGTWDTRANTPSRIRYRWKKRVRLHPSATK